MDILIEQNSSRLDADTCIVMSVLEAVDGIY